MTTKMRQVGIEARYTKQGGHIGGARAVRNSNGLIVGHIVRTYEAYGSKVSGWKFIATDWSGLDYHYYSANLGAKSMERAVLDLAAKGEQKAAA